MSTIRRLSFKTWGQSKANIEQTLNAGRYDAYDNELSLTYGIHYRHTLSHYPCHVFSAVYRQGSKSGLEYYIVNYVTSDTGESVIGQWKFSATDDSSKVIKKISIRQSLKILIWIPNQRAYIGYCGDMTLRGFTGVKFEEKSRLTVHSTVLCMIYVEDFDELITAGQGYVFSWVIRMVAFGLLVDIKEPPLRSDVNSSREWVHRLFYDKHTKTLMALTDETVYMISLVSRMQIDMIHNTHKASLTSCAFYHPYLYYITAARDGTIHIYHTGVQAIIRTFSAHRDGITGVLTLPHQPILISWSHTSGSLRMWRLDTLELTNETTLSENINHLELARDDRLFYLSDSEVRIYDVNVLYSIFTTLSAPAEYFKVCSVRRINNDLPTENQNKKKISKKFKDIIHSPAGHMEKTRGKKMIPFVTSSDVCHGFPQTPDSTQSTPLLGSDESQHIRYSVDFDGHYDENEESFLDQRLVCVLDNHCIMGVSPVSGQVLNIIYPSLKSDRPPVCLDIENSGNAHYVALADGKLVEFDCSVNPGQVANVFMPEKEKMMHVYAVVSMELYVEEGSKLGLRRQGVFIGLENGNICLHDGGEKVEPKRGYERINRKRNKRKRSSINKIGPVLTMSSMKAHLGKVTSLYAPYEGSLAMSISDEENEDQGHQIVIHNILISCGMDHQVIVWRVSTVPGATPLKLEVLLHKLRLMHLTATPTCLAVTSNVVLFGFHKGILQMDKFIWKRYLSTRGAKIKLECTSIALHAFVKIPLGIELLHKGTVTSVYESHLLRLFVTAAKDNTLKIWDCEGQLIRELLLGDSVPSACFLRGRDILALMRTHILRIEVHRYLPTEYLLKILEIDRAGGVEDIEPEEPKPMEGPAESIYFFVKDQTISEEDMILPTQAEELLSENEERKQINQMLRYMKKRKTFFSTAMQAMEEFKNERETVFGIELKDAVPATKPQDNAADFVASLNPQAMAKHAVAPDGYIPNSVIRDAVKSIYPRPAFAFMQRKGSKNRTIIFTGSKDTFSSLDMGSLSNFPSESDDDVRYVLSDTSSSGSGTSYRPFNRHSVTREMELKSYLKGRRKEGVLESQSLQNRFPVRRPRKKENQAEHAKGKKQRRKSSFVSGKEMDSPRVPDKLTNLLEVLSREAWCPSIVTLKNLDEALFAIADILINASARTSVEICKFLCMLWDVCRGKEGKKIYHRYFSLPVQKRYGEAVQDMLLSTLPSLQKAAVELLCKFENDVLKDVIMSAIMPKFLRRIPNTPLLSFQTQEVVVATAARAVKFMSTELDIGQVHTLSRMIGVNKYRGKKYDEVACTSGLAKALLKAGVDVIDGTVWSSFILPLLSKQPGLAEKEEKYAIPSDAALYSPEGSSLSVASTSQKDLFQISHEADSQEEDVEQKRTVSFLAIPHSKSFVDSTSSLDHQDEAGTDIADEPGYDQPSISSIKIDQALSSSSSSIFLRSALALKRRDDLSEDSDSYVYLTDSSGNTSRTTQHKSSRRSDRLIHSRSSNSNRESLQILRNLRRTSIMTKSDHSHARARKKKHKETHKKRFSERDLDRFKSEPSISSLTIISSSDSRQPQKSLSHSATATGSLRDEAGLLVETKVVSESLISSTDSPQTALVPEADDQAQDTNLLSSSASSKSGDTLLSTMAGSHLEELSFSHAPSSHHSLSSPDKVLSEQNLPVVASVHSQASCASGQEKIEPLPSTDELQASTEALLHLQSVLRKKMSATVEKLPEENVEPSVPAESPRFELPKVKTIYKPRRNTVAHYILSEMNKQNLTRPCLSDGANTWLKSKEIENPFQNLTHDKAKSLSFTFTLEKSTNENPFSNDKFSSASLKDSKRKSEPEACNRLADDKVPIDLKDGNKKIELEICGISQKPDILPPVKEKLKPSTPSDTCNRLPDDKVLTNLRNSAQKIQLEAHAISRSGEVSASLNQKSRPTTPSTKRRCWNDVILLNKFKEMQKRSEAGQRETSQETEVLQPLKENDKASPVLTTLDEESSNQMKSIITPTKDKPILPVVSLQPSKQELDEIFESLKNLPSSSSPELFKQKLSVILSGYWLTEDGRIIKIKDLDSSDWHDIMKILQNIREKSSTLPQPKKPVLDKSILLPPKPRPPKPTSQHPSFGNDDEDKQTDRADYSFFEVPGNSPMFGGNKDINIVTLKKQVVKYLGDCSKNASRPVSGNITKSKQERGDQETVYEWKLPPCHISITRFPELA